VKLRKSILSLLPALALALLCAACVKKPPESDPTPAKPPAQETQQTSPNGGETQTPPTDPVPEGTLLTLRIGVSEEEAAAAHPVARHELARRADDEDGPAYLTLVTCEAESAQVRVERSASGSELTHLAGIEGVLLPGETVCDLTMTRGQTLVLRTTLPWHPEARVTARQGDFFGEYVFGAENSEHLENENGRMSVRYVKGISYTAENRDCDYADAAGLLRWLEGTWSYRAADGTPLGLLRFDAAKQTLRIVTEEAETEVRFDPAHLYAEAERDAPDLLCLNAGGDASPAGIVEALGDYLVTGAVTDTEELLYLIQANNGDGALDRLLPGGGTAFLLHRYRGGDTGGAPESGRYFPALVWKYEAGSGRIWTTRAFAFEQNETGAPIYVYSFDRIAVPYASADRSVFAPLLACGDPAYPMRVFWLAVDESGRVTDVFPSDGGAAESDPLRFADGEEYRAFLTGTWRVVPAEPTEPELTLTLREDGTFFAQCVAAERTEYEGRWRLRHLFASEEQLPDCLRLDLQRTNDPAWQGETALGEFRIDARTVCGGRYLIRIVQVSEGESLLARACGRYAAPLERRTGAAAPAAQETPQAWAHFCAICWAVTEDADGTLLWLDDVQSDEFTIQRGRYEAVPHRLAAGAELRLDPAELGGGAYVVEVRTDGSGALTLLDWAIPYTEPARFDRLDPVLGDLRLGMTENEVRAEYGEPEEETLENGAVRWRDPGLMLTFSDVYGTGERVLSAVEIDGGFLRLYNGLRVGFTAEEVRACWYDDGLDRPIGGEEPWGRYLYGDCLALEGSAPPPYPEYTAYRTLPDGRQGTYDIVYQCYTPRGEGTELCELIFSMTAESDSIRSIVWRARIL